MGDTHRKIQLVGNRSYAVSLPKKWVLNNRLEKSKEVKIIERDNDLIITSKKDINQSNDKIILVEDLQLIQSIILISYTKGLNKLILKFKSKKDYLFAKPIVLESLSHLEGYKIRAEKNNQIIISALYNELNIPINDLIKRMCIIFNNMIDCIIQKNDKTKEILEKELDLIYHLSKRALYICSTDSLIMKTNKIKDLEEIFLLRLIFKKLENIGDILEKISKKTIERENILLIFNSLNDCFILNKKITIQKIQEIKKKKYNHLNNDKLKELVVDVLNNFLLIQLNKNLFD
ncbi:MAG: AbrB/MazE/SpoVT family DNA-binding domain-containing protein [Candidatus Woesearchaeota archaeon]